MGKPVWICADVRHQEDLQWYLDFYANQVKRIRITASEAVRKSRGWNFTPAVDEGPSECDLDERTDWDLVINNSSEDSTELDAAVNLIMSWIGEAVPAAAACS